MTTLHILRVFCGPQDSGGNALGVVLDGPAVQGVAERQRVAAELGFSETVFVDDPGRGGVDIYTPSERLAFAGHPLVGTGWLLRREGVTVPVLRPQAGEVAAWQSGEFSWIRARAEWATGRRTRQYRTPAEVDALGVPPVGTGWLYAWAWRDRAEGTVRARAFPGRGDGIDEDEATGAAALALTAELDRPLDIRQGTGSQILTRLLPDGVVDVGGRVELQETRPLGGRRS